MSDIDYEYATDSDETISPKSPPPTEVEILEDREDYDFIINNDYKPEKKIKNKKGRPPKTMEEKLAKKTILKEKIIYMIQDKDGNFKKSRNPNLTQRELKKIEYEKERERKEIELGKKLVARKNGKIDNRSMKTRTQGQIEATKKLVALNKKRKEERENYKTKNDKNMIKESIREVVHEPFYKPIKPQEPINPYAGMIF